MHIFLFGGTTEGRKIAEAIVEVNREWAARDAAACAAHESSGLPIAAEVYVTTAYGASLLPAGPGIRVHVGRLDAEEMTTLFMEARQTSASLLVIDATHPYAAVVSENILTACAAAGVRCIRVEREDSGAEEHGTESAQKALPERESTGEDGKASAPEAAAFHWVESIEEAAAWLAGESAQRPNILITTGSKELAPYTRIPDFAARCYVRALPTVEALEKCQALGFRRDHLILMQGPFSEEMNVAQLRYADAGYLVTKASGETGGFPEKCEAALALGVEVICVGRPKEVSIPDAAWYDREKSDAVLRRIHEIGRVGTCGRSATERSEEQAEAADRGII